MRIQVMCCSLWVGMLAIRLVLLALSFYLLLAGAKTAEKLCGGSIFFALLTCLSGFTRFAGALLPIWIVVKGSIIFSAFLFPERINQVIDERAAAYPRTLGVGEAAPPLDKITM